jgi:hypothetical protein
MSQWESTLIKNLCERLKNITELFVLQDKSVIDVREMCSMLAQYYENKIPVQLMYEMYDRMYHMTRQEVMGKLKKLAKTLYYQGFDYLDPRIMNVSQFNLGIPA